MIIELPYFLEGRAINSVTPPRHVGKLRRRATRRKRMLAPSRIGTISIKFRRTLDLNDNNFMLAPVNVGDNLMRADDRRRLVIHMHEITMLRRLAKVDAAMITDRHRAKTYQE